ncbi:hypothetical protein ACGH7X_24005 [Streptomyces sp. BBFR51]|uniref:hypothetical protein n=1 Tax=Streptomyces sp. BBFR51 TaxID=3372856 RepID=UPI0037DD7990
MRRIPAAFATCALAALGAVVPATGAQAATSCETAWRNASPGYLHIYSGTDCGGLLGRTSANDPDWGDASGSVRGVEVGEAGSLLHKGTSGLAVRLYRGIGYTGAHVCLTRAEAYVPDLRESAFPDGTPLDAARSHRWTRASDCDRFLS